LRYRVGLGDGGIPDLAQAVRVHGNFIETVPFLLILMGLMELAHISPIYLHIYGSAAVFSRLLHAYGVTSTPLASKGRFLGTVLTMLLLTAASFTLIIKSL